ncbi:hypothetical protein E8E11_006374 [Didymella keratinophila]|nr:hypothetical protein E8E11_006374 [Didymella keratinophila]
MSQPLIFITGATGFIGAHVVTQALSAGYHVRLSVRKEAQISNVRKVFSSHSANLDFVVVPDFTSTGAFEKALHGNDYVKSAVDGTTALLNTAKTVDTIKRVVIVSSFLALIPLDALVTGKFTAKEGQKIDIDPQMSFPTDPRTAGGLKYHASKILAHRATLSCEKEGWTWDRVAEFVRQKYEFVGVKVKGPFEQPPSVDTSKAERVLGFGWRIMEDTVGSFLDHQIELRSKL